MCWRRGETDVRERQKRWFTVRPLTHLSPRFQSEVQHPALRCRMETASVPSGSTLRNAVGHFKPQLIVARKRKYLTTPIAIVSDIEVEKFGEAPPPARPASWPGCCLPFHRWLDEKKLLWPEVWVKLRRRFASSWVILACFSSPTSFRVDFHASTSVAKVV